MTDIVVLQRLRNRIIEYLELVSSLDAQRAYQARAPVHVPNEIINQWEDWVQGPDEFGPPVFSPAECDAIKRYHSTWEDVAASTPDPLPDLEACMQLPLWHRLRDAAVDTVRAFHARGRSSEDGAVQS